MTVTLRNLLIMLVLALMVFVFRGNLLHLGTTVADDVHLIGTTTGALLGTSTSTTAATSTSSVTASSTHGTTSTSTISSTTLPPVTAGTSGDATALTVAGIIRITNQDRAKQGLLPLTQNIDLDRSAELKLKDMFSNQYFEHVSPSGTSVINLANEVGYQYIVIGENLALGNFGGDANVMAAWMNSPGHRANILDKRYQDIGVAVGEGMYQGKEQWIAVQHFGKALDSCPAVDTQLKSSIDAARADLQTRQTAITALKAVIDAMTSTSTNPTYQSDVEQYNIEVGEYNRRLDNLTTAVTQYNEEVVEFNSCAGLS